MKPYFIFLLAAILLFPSIAQSRDKTGVVQRGDYLKRSEVQTFIREVSQRHNIPAIDLTGILAQGKKSQRIIDLISKPAEGKPWHEYRKIFLGDKRINAGVEFWKENVEILDEADAAYGVPPEIIVAIIGVETFYGTRMGTFPVLDALMTLGFDYPPRADFFRSELEHFVLLSQEESIDPHEPKGSYAGAMGMGQFIPSSYRNYAIDFDADGKRDLWHNKKDGIGSVANYFKEHGWQPGQPVITRASATGSLWNKLDSSKLKPRYDIAEFKKHKIKPVEKVTATGQHSFVELEGEKKPELWIGHENFYVITRYNHSEKYAMAVYQLGQEIKKKYMAEEKRTKLESEK